MRYKMAKYLIIGASSTIGQEVIKMLIQFGHECISTARNNNKITPDIIVDATDFKAIDNIFEKYGPFDGAVNCCGSLLLKPAHLTDYNSYMEVIHASLTTSFALVRAAAKSMRNGGSIVLISSAAASEGLANHDAIAAAKSGVNGLMRSAAASYASMNLRFNCIAPGLTETNLTKNITNSPSAKKFSSDMHALGRIGKPQDIARAICFLLDKDNDWITGQVFAIDGGLSNIRPKARA
jgi:3-oxoacyl-[acyl-carrier protein] reductase